MMNLFNKKAAPMITPETDASGVAAIRRGLHARRSDLSRISRDVGVATESLHSFLNGGKMADIHLKALTERIFGGAFRYLPDVDALEHADKKPATVVNVDCVAPLVVGTPPTSAEVLDKMTRNDAPPPPSARPAWLRS